MKPILAGPVALLLAATAWAGWPAADTGAGVVAEVEATPPTEACAPPPLVEAELPERAHLASAARGPLACDPAEGAEPAAPVGLILCGGEDLPPEDGEDLRSVAPPPASALPFDVRLVDAESGRPSARATWTLSLRSGATLPEGVPVGTMPVKDARVAGALLITPGPSEIAFDAPQVDLPVSRYAERLAITYPLRREVTATLSVRTAEGCSPSGELGVITWIAGQRVQAPSRELARAPADAPGHALLEVPGIALLRGERLSINVHEVRGRDTFTVDWAGSLGHDGRTRLDLDLVLPALPDPPQAFRGRGGHRNLRCGCGSRRVREPLETGVLLLTGLRRDGRPAVGASVRVRSRDDGELAGFHRALDRTGQAAFPGLEAGLWQVELREVGLVPTTQEVRVRAGEATRFRLEEDPGAALLVEVVDGEGRPLPFATVEVVETPSGIGWVDLARDVERLDAFTDEAGRRTLDRLGPGPTKLRARYGSRRVEETIDVPPAGSVPVRLVVG